MGTSEPIISSTLIATYESGGVYSNRKGVYSMRIQGNYLCEVADMQAPVLAVDGDEEEDEEDEDEESHDDEEQEDDEEEETVWTSPQRAGKWNLI
jgi:Ran GTPase-activating protein (RanGAP) involved in mRNA processing and transport